MDTSAICAEWRVPGGGGDHGKKAMIIQSSAQICEYHFQALHSLIFSYFTNPTYKPDGLAGQLTRKTFHL